MALPELTLEVISGPKPPAFNMEGNIEALQESMAMQNEHNKQLARFQGELYNILHNGNLVRSFQVEKLTADKLIAGTIAVDKIYLGDTTFELSGILKRIIIKDDSDTVRVDFGRFGAGTDYGMKLYDLAGAVIIDLTGLGANVVTTTSIKADAITNAKIAAGAIDTLEIASSAITSIKINVGAVDSTALGTNSVINSKIGSSAVDTLEINANAITNAKIAVGAVDTLELATNSITNAKIAVDAVDSLEIKADAITNAKIAVDAVNTLEIQSAAITNAKIASNAVDTLEINADAITNLKVDTNAIDTLEINTSAIETIKINADDVTSFKHQVLATATFNNLQPGTLNQDTVWRSAIKNHTHSEDGPLAMAYTTSDNFADIGTPTADTKVTLATFMVTNSATVVGTIATMGNHAGSQNFTDLDADLSYFFW